MENEKRIFINEMTIQRYKSIKDMSIKVKDFNVLVGKNNVGKTNFLDCLKFVSELTKYNLNEITQKRGGYKSIIYGGNKKDYVHIYISFKDNKRNIYVYDLCFNDRHIIEESLTINNIKWLKRDNNSSSIEYYDPLRKGYVRTGYSQVLSLLRIYDQYGYNTDAPMYNEENIDLLNYLKSWKFYKLNPSIMRTTSRVKKIYDIGTEGMDLSRTLHSIRSSHLHIFNEIVDSLKSGIDEIEDLYSLLDNSDPAKTYISVKEKSFKNSFDLNQISDGTLVILAHLTIIYSPESKGLICIEEPESYIHPKLMKYLRDVLKSSNSQVIAVTHSPYFTDALKPEDVFIVKKIDGQTILDEVISQSQLLKYLQTLTLGELLYSEETEDEVYHKDEK